MKLSAELRKLADLVRRPIVSPIRNPRNVEYTVVDPKKFKKLAVKWFGIGNEDYIKKRFKKGFSFWWHDNNIWIDARSVAFDSQAELRNVAKQYGLKFKENW